MMQPPKAPEKPLSAYMRFSKKCWESVRTEHPDLKLWEIGSIIGGKWRDLDPKEKKEYQDAWTSDKSRYDVEIAAYRNSPEYKSYLKAKSDEEQAQQTAGAAATPVTAASATPVKTASPTPPAPQINNVRLPTQPTYVPSPSTTVQVVQQQLPQQQQQQLLQQRQIIVTSAPQQLPQTPARIITMPVAAAALQAPPPPTVAAAAAFDRCINIQPAEDEGDAADESLSVKHVARARYMRNQFLADKLFGRGGSESVPDTRQVVTENKLRVLRRQVNSLTQFQSKLEKELEALGEKHEGRKRRFESSIATFEVEMKKYAGKTVVVDQDMIDKQVQNLRQARNLTAPAASSPPTSALSPADAPSSPAKMETLAAARTTTPTPTAILTKGAVNPTPAPVAAVAAAAEVDRGGASLTPTNA